MEVVSCDLAQRRIDLREHGACFKVARATGVTSLSKGAELTAGEIVSFFNVAGFN